MIQEIILVLAVCTDAFIAAAAYGAGNIRIPVISAFIISVIGTAVLTGSLLLSSALGGVIPENVCRWLGFALLLCIGIVSLCQNTLKALIRKLKGDKRLSFRLFSINFVIEVYLDETKADIDCSKSLSCKEALTLAAALSADSLASGVGAGLCGVNILRTAVLSMLLGMAAVASGSAAGRALRKKAELSWLSGAFLILLAFSKLLTI